MQAQPYSAAGGGMAAFGGLTNGMMGGMASHHPSSAHHHPGAGPPGHHPQQAHQPVQHLAFGGGGGHPHPGMTSQPGQPGIHHPLAAKIGQPQMGGAGGQPGAGGMGTMQFGNIQAINGSQGGGPPGGMGMGGAAAAMGIAGGMGAAGPAPRRPAISMPSSGVLQSASPMAPQNPPTSYPAVPQHGSPAPAHPPPNHSTPSQHQSPHPSAAPSSAAAAQLAQVQAQAQQQQPPRPPTSNAATNPQQAPPSQQQHAQQHAQQQQHQYFQPPPAPLQHPTGRGSPTMSTAGMNLPPAGGSGGGIASSFPYGVPSRGMGIGPGGQQNEVGIPQQQQQQQGRQPVQTPTSTPAGPPGPPNGMSPAPPGTQSRSPSLSLLGPGGNSMPPPAGGKPVAAAGQAPPATYASAVAIGGMFNHAPGRYPNPFQNGEIKPSPSSTPAPANAPTPAQQHPQQGGGIGGGATEQTGSPQAGGAQRNHSVQFPHHPAVPASAALRGWPNGISAAGASSALQASAQAHQAPVAEAPAGASGPPPPSSTPPAPDLRQLFNTYLYDYLLRAEMHDVARAFLRAVGPEVYLQENAPATVNGVVGGGGGGGVGNVGVNEAAARDRTASSLSSGAMNAIPSAASTTSSPARSSPPMQQNRGGGAFPAFPGTANLQPGNSGGSPRPSEASSGAALPRPKFPIESPQGLLYEWWCVFWDIWRARERGGRQRPQPGHPPFQVPNQTGSSHAAQAYYLRNQPSLQASSGQHGALARARVRRDGWREIGGGEGEEKKPGLLTGDQAQAQAMMQAAQAQKDRERDRDRDRVLFRAGNIGMMSHSQGPAVSAAAAAAMMAAGRQQVSGGEGQAVSAAFDKADGQVGVLARQKALNAGQNGLMPNQEFNGVMGPPTQRPPSRPSSRIDGSPGIGPAVPQREPSRASHHNSPAFNPSTLRKEHPTGGEDDGSGRAGKKIRLGGGAQPSPGASEGATPAAADVKRTQSLAGVRREHGETPIEMTMSPSSMDTPSLGAHQRGLTGGYPGGINGIFAGGQNKGPGSRPQSALQHQHHPDGVPQSGPVADGSMPPPPAPSTSGAGRGSVSERSGPSPPQRPVSSASSQQPTRPVSHATIMQNAFANVTSSIKTEHDVPPPTATTAGSQQMAETVALPPSVNGEADIKDIKVGNDADGLELSNFLDWGQEDNLQGEARARATAVGGSLSTAQSNGGLLGQLNAASTGSTELDNDIFVAPGTEHNFDFLNDQNSALWGNEEWAFLGPSSFS